ncbi:MAG: glycosyltransferase [bacterium]
MKLKPGKNLAQYKVSIILAARNEEKNIAKCLNAILQQKYPKSKLEIIVIDDRSEDSTATIVKKMANSHHQIKLLQIRDISPYLAPKKRAIDSGIRQAKGEIIVTTDADCQPGPNWISELVKYFEPTVGLVAGFNPYKTGNSKSSLFQQMLALDYFAMACVAAASAGLKYPLSCSGGNLAYRKALYLQYGGFRNIGKLVSGDDDLFLEQVRENTNWKVRYAIHPETFVPTAPPTNLKAFWHQRLRYASKGRHYRLSTTLSLSAVYFLNFLLVSGLFISLFKIQIFWIWLLVFLFKWLFEFAFLKKGQQVFNCKFNLVNFILTAILHPIYIALVGLMAQISTFQWKENTYSARLHKQAIQI